MTDNIFVYIVSIVTIQKKYVLSIVQIMISVKMPKEDKKKWLSYQEENCS